MAIRLLAILFLASMLHVSGAVEDFIGTWEIHADAAAEDTEIKYPVHMTISYTNGHLKGTYTDQEGYNGEFSLVVTTNKDQDLLLAMAFWTKSPSAFSPIHHVKLVNGQLRGICLTTDKEFEWIGVRKNR